ncbi:MAG: hypothetical protein INR72_18505 [Williamsia herbipolensis]|nr:hypothetical protein [Williamsia herbipolensis]
MTTLLVVGLATSLDRYLWVDSVRTGTVNRPRRVEDQAGGKALHVARAAATLGATVRAVSVIGGRTGQRVRDLGERAPWTTSWVEVEADTRVCTSVIDAVDDSMTEFYEPVPSLGTHDWDPIVRTVTDAVRDQPDVAVVSGQLPRGLPDDGLAALVRLIADADVPVFLDSAGPPLAVALTAGPDVVKVTAAEAAGALGTAGADEDPHTLATALVAAGAANAVITCGAEGAVFASGRDSMTVSAPPVAPAWPVGSGDSFTAGLAVARASGRSWDDSLRRAAGAAAANAAAPIAAAFTRSAADAYTAEARTIATS